MTSQQRETQNGSHQRCRPLTYDRWQKRFENDHPGGENLHNQ